MKTLPQHIKYITIKSALKFTNKSGSRRPEKSRKCGIFLWLIFSFHVFSCFGFFLCSFAIRLPKSGHPKRKRFKNKAGNTATQVACGWAGAIFEVTRPFGQGQWGKKKIIKITRPDTRQSSRGWFGRSSNAKTARDSKMWPTYRPTYRPTL